MLSDYNKTVPSSSSSSSSSSSMKSSSRLKSGYVLTLDEDQRSLSKEVQKKILTTAYAMGLEQDVNDDIRNEENINDRRYNDCEGRDGADDDLNGMDVTIDFSGGKVGTTPTTDFNNQIITQTLSANKDHGLEDDMNTPLISPVSKSPRKRVRRVRSVGSSPNLSTPPSSSSSSSSKRNMNRQFANKKALIFYQEEEDLSGDLSQENAAHFLNSPLNNKKKMNFLQRLSHISSNRKKKRRSKSSSATITSSNTTQKATKTSIPQDDASSSSLKIMIVTEESDIEFERRESEKATPFVLDVSIISESSVESDNNIEIDPSSNGFCFAVADEMDFY